MASRRPSPALPIVVALRVGDHSLRERLILEVEASPDFVWSEDVGDVMIADEAWLHDAGRAPAVVLMAAADATELPPEVRALLPPGSSALVAVSAARLVAEGLVVFPVGSADWPLPDREIEEVPPAATAAALTPREQEVLQLLAAGASNKVIARLLGVSVHTAKFHVASLLRKLGAGSRLEAVGLGLRTGLLML